MSMLIEKCDEALKDIEKCVALKPTALGHMQVTLSVDMVR